MSEALSLSVAERLKALRSVKPRGYETKLFSDLLDQSPEIIKLLEVDFYSKSQIYDQFKEELDKYEITSTKFYRTLNKVIETYKENPKNKANIATDEDSDVNGNDDSVNEPFTADKVFEN